MRTRNRCPCSLWASWFFKWGKGWGWIGELGPRGGLSGLPTPLVLCAGITQKYPLFGPGTSEVTVGLCPFCILLFIITSTVPACSYFKSLIINFFVFRCLRRHLSRCSPPVKGPRTQPVSVSFPLSVCAIKILAGITVWGMMVFLCLDPRYFITFSMM